MARRVPWQLAPIDLLHRTPQVEPPGEGARQPVEALPPVHDAAGITILQDHLELLYEPRRCQALMVSWFYSRRCDYFTVIEWRGYALCGIHRRPGVRVTEEW